ncbi:hypothetical protein [Paraglaciecola sp.]|uniref:hypothetical protein n=1 Tax=Paraglaciecola sp. TaxID=1920173 RepID=UPI003EF68BA0
MNSTIEIVTYKLKPGIADEQLQNTHSTLNSFCSEQEGFIYRSISQDQENTWFDIVYWKNMECAKKAGDNFMKSKVCQTLNELIDDKTLVMRHMQADSEKCSTN